MGQRGVASPATATTDFLAPDIFNKSGLAVPAPIIGSTLATIFAEGCHPSTVPASARAARHHRRTGGAAKDPLTVGVEHRPRPSGGHIAAS
jgi:hypothetical protein